MKRHDHDLRAKLVDSSPTDGSATTCTGFPNTDSCTGETICVQGQCVPLFGRTYQFQVMAVAIPTTDSLGEPWDLNGGAPDPYVVVEMNNVEVLRTAVVGNSFFPSLTAETGLHVITAGAVIKATIFDEDLDTDDEVFVCTANPIRPDDLRAVNITCAAGAIVDPPALQLALFTK